MSPFMLSAPLNDSQSPEEEYARNRANGVLENALFERDGVRKLDSDPPFPDGYGPQRLPAHYDPLCTLLYATAADRLALERPDLKLPRQIRRDADCVNSCLYRRVRADDNDLREAKRLLAIARKEGKVRQKEIDRRKREREEDERRNSSQHLDSSMGQSRRDSQDSSTRSNSTLVEKEQGTPPSTPSSPQPAPNWEGKHAQAPRSSCRDPPAGLQLINEETQDVRQRRTPGEWEAVETMLALFHSPGSHNASAASTAPVPTTSPRSSQPTLGDGSMAAQPSAKRRKLTPKINKDAEANLKRDVRVAGESSSVKDAPSAVRAPSETEKALKRPKRRGSPRPQDLSPEHFVTGPSFSPPLSTLASRTSWSELIPSDPDVWRDITIPPEDLRSYFPDRLQDLEFRIIELAGIKPAKRDNYYAFKESLFRKWVWWRKNMNGKEFNKTAAQSIRGFDVKVISKLHLWFEKVGWYKDENFTAEKINTAKAAWKEKQSRETGKGKEKSNEMNKNGVQRDVDVLYQPL